jgi:hypothetical protein
MGTKAMKILGLDDMMILSRHNLVLFLYAVRFHLSLSVHSLSGPQQPASRFTTSSCRSP